MKPNLRFKLPTAAGLFTATLMLAACSAGFAGAWPPPWHGANDPQTIGGAAVDFSPVDFRAPQANHCRGTPPVRETQAGFGTTGRIFGRAEAPASTREHARTDTAAAARDSAAAKSPAERPAADARLLNIEPAELARSRSRSA
ncbi:MAG: hypothetical protein ABIO45_07515 [Burkholderiaceae bacterium]